MICHHADGWQSYTEANPKISVENENDLQPVWNHIWTAPDKLFLLLYFIAQAHNKAQLNPHHSCCKIHMMRWSQSWEESWCNAVVKYLPEFIAEWSQAAAAELRKPSGSHHEGLGDTKQQMHWVILYLLWYYCCDCSPRHQDY